MSVSYTCPNPDCGVTLKTPVRVAVGKSVKCPKCGTPFVPEPVEKDAPAGVLKLAEEPKKPAPVPVPAAAKKSLDDDDDEDAASVKKGYGVIAETDQEKEEAEKHKPQFGEIQDKFKKSARGPAMGLLVMPSNLLTLEGLITGVAGIGLVVKGMWPLVFNDAPPDEEEVEGAIVDMLLGVVTLFWGAVVCFGASNMQELSSYPWAMVGSVMGVLPFLGIGIYAIIMLQNPKVKAGFEESDSGVEEEGDEDDDPKKKKKKGKDDDDEEEEDEDDD